MSSSRLWRAAVAVAAIVLATAASPPPAGFVPPVDAPITDGFRPPATPYGPGNRGVDYDTAPGDPVRASGSGEVVFAGAVGGTLHVTLLHAGESGGDNNGDLRTSYSFLQAVEVVVGQRVVQGERIGAAGDTLHFGARRGEGYFDPTTLFDAPRPAGAASDVEVELLPFEVPPGSGEAGEREALVQLAFERREGFDVVDWLVERRTLANHYLAQIDPQQAFGSAVELATRLRDPPPCDDTAPPREPVAGQDRQALLVGGLGSSVESASINDLRTGELGYRDDDVTRLAYDSEGDLVEAGRKLADQVESLAAEHPGATVDLYGHSMGGVVVRLGLAELQRRGFDLGRLGLVTTFGSPHQGADLATAAVAAGVWTDRPAVPQLAETSELMADLARVGIPEGVHVLSLSASGDVVVASPRTVVPDATNVTVGTPAGQAPHGDLVAADESTREVAKALAGQPPSCEDPREVVEEYVTGRAISYAEDLVGFAVLARGG